MISYELIEWTKEKINENCGQAEHTSDAIRIRCPFCGDSRKKAGKKRGNYYLKTASYYCFNCQHATDSYGLVAELECKPYHSVKAEFFKYEHGGGGNFEYIQTFGDDIVEKNVIEEFIVPNTWVTIEDTPKRYVDSRMIDKAPNMSEYWKLYFNTQTDRLVIPWYVKGKIVYYQERALYKNQVPKYLFPKDTAGRPVFGIDNIREDYPYIFYLEGALDSIWVLNGVATGSISLSESQKEMMSNFFTHEIVYFPDNPWVDKASKDNIIKLAQTHKDLKVWMWPKNFKEKDVNELVCNIGITDFFYHTNLHENIVSVQKARCMLELTA